MGANPLQCSVCWFTVHVSNSVPETGPWLALDRALTGSWLAHDWAMAGPWLVMTWPWLGLDLPLTGPWLGHFWALTGHDWALTGSWLVHDWVLTEPDEPWLNLNLGSSVFLYSRCCVWFCFQSGWGNRNDTRSKTKNELEHWVLFLNKIISMVTSEVSVNLNVQL